MYSLAHNGKPIIAAVDGIAISIGIAMLFHWGSVLASTTATFSTPFVRLGLVPEAASSLLMPAHHGTSARLRHAGDGTHMSADDADADRFVNVVVAPGRTKAEARKAARDICACQRKRLRFSQLLRLPPKDVTRQIDQESHLFGERMRSKEAVAAFKPFWRRRRPEPASPSSRELALQTSRGCREVTPGPHGSRRRVRLLAMRVKHCEIVARPR